MSRLYSDFLEHKVRAAWHHGPAVDPADLHPSLFPFQRDLTVWALRKGRAAIFADTGLGKTRMQLEWARHIAGTALIVAPLSVARQTVREASALDLEITYVRRQEDVTGPGVWITNYEMVDRFDPALFGAVVLDESSILKNVAGKMKDRLIEQFTSTPYRLACTATPAPNDVSELANHSEFLGALPRVEMLAAYFIHDDDGWRLKGHAVDPMFKWMSGWAAALRRPSDLGYDDAGYDLPPLRIHAETVATPFDAPGQLFATDLGGVSGRASARRQTLTERVERSVKLMGADHQWIAWCGLNGEAQAITEAVAGAVNVEGSQSPEQKADALAAFQDGDIRVLVTKPSIAGFGMNFQNCSRMVFVGMNDSYEAYYQAIRRCYRFGQTEPVDVHIVVSELETAIVDNVKRKEREAATATDLLVKHMAVAA